MPKIETINSVRITLTHVEIEKILESYARDYCNLKGVISTQLKPIDGTTVSCIFRYNYEYTEDREI